MPGDGSNGEREALQDAFMRRAARARAKAVVSYGNWNYAPDEETGFSSILWGWTQVGRSHHNRIRLDYLLEGEWSEK